MRSLVFALFACVLAVSCAAESETPSVPPASVPASTPVAATPAADPATEPEPEPEPEPECERASEPASIQNEYGKVVGTLVVPAGCAAHPLVIFLAGSGAIDRDGGTPKTYRQIADALAAAGIGSLRFDKRGYFASSAAGPDRNEDFRFSMYVDDAVAWIEKMRMDKRFDRVVLAGHSEGSTVGIVAASRVDVDGLISLAGPGRRTSEIVRWQMQRKYEQDETLLAAANRIIDELAAGRTTADVPPALAQTFDLSIQPYLISWFEVDPASVLAGLGVETLIVQGETDWQVPPSEASVLEAAATHGKVVLIPKMNHVLKQAGDDEVSQRKAYTTAGVPLGDGLVAALTAFITAK